MANDREILLSARDLIKEQCFDEARALLRQIPQNPKAQDWLAKLDQIDPPLEFPLATPAPRPAQSLQNQRGVLLWGALVGGLLTVGVGLVIVVVILLTALGDDEGDDKKASGGSSSNNAINQLVGGGSSSDGGDLDIPPGVSSIDAAIAYDATRVFDNLSPITPDNASQLTWLLETERTYLDLMWGTDNMLYMPALPGVYAFNANDVRQKPDLLLAGENEIVLSISADGRYGIGVPQGGGSGSVSHVSVWNIQNGTYVSQINLSMDDEMDEAAISPDGRWVGGIVEPDNGDDILVIWDAQTGTVQQSITDFSVPENQSYYGDLDSIMFSSSGRYVAAEVNFSNSDLIQVWDVQTGALVSNIDAWYGNIFFGPGDSWLLTMGEEELDVWGLPGGDHIASYEESDAYIMDAAPTPDGGGVLLAGAVGQNGRYGITRWNIANGQMTPFVSDEIAFHIAFSPDGTKVAGMLYSGEVMVWDAATGAVLQSTRGDTSDQVSLLAWPVFTSDGFHVGTLDIGTAQANANDNNWANNAISIATRDVHTGAVVARVALGPFGEDDDVLYNNHVSGDGRLLVLTVGDSIQVWDVVQGVQVATLLQGDVEGIALSYDGQLLAAHGYDSNVIVVWDVAQRSRIATLEKPDASYYSDLIAFSRDSRFLVIVNWNNVDVWDITAGQMVQADWGDSRPYLTAYNLDNADEDIEAVAFSPDGRFLAVARDGWPVIELWDVTTGGLHATFDLPASTDPYDSFPYLDSVTFNSAGTLLVTGIEGRFVMWDVATGRQVADVQEYWIGNVTFSPDDRYLVSSSINWTATQQVYGVPR